MKILVLGAGGTGGYFGGRLAAAGADVSFLVRPHRAAQLRNDGLVVRSPFGDLRLAVQTVLAGSLKPVFDLVLITCKAYDLDAALADVSSGVGERALVAPLLNGLRHMPVLDARFGRGRVLGSLCQIAATLSEQGEVLHLNNYHILTIGARSAEQAAAVADIGHNLDKAGFTVRIADDIEREMWEKFAMLTTLAAMTCLMRGSVGEIMTSRDGAALMDETLDACVAVARAGGAAIAPAWVDKTRAFLTTRASTMTASMLRDLEAGGRTEADHIVGDMLARAEQAGVSAPILRAAYCHLQTAQARNRRQA